MSDIATTEPRRNEIAAIKDGTVGAVEARIAELVDNQQLMLPANYSAGNALQSAWLVLQDVQDRDKRPALEVCSRASIMQALFSMVVQALNPEKKQGYFIVYGKSLTFQRSYFGTLAVAKRMGGIQDAFAEIIYQGDTFEYEIRRGNKVVTKHTQSLDTIDGGDIRAAYAVVMFDDTERDDYTELMTWDQIQKSWSKSKMSPGKDTSTHSQFTSEMVKRTVLNRSLKRFINSSSDDHLFLQEFNRDTTAAVETAVDEDAAVHANRDALDFPEEPGSDDRMIGDEDRTIDVESREAPRDDGALFPNEPGF